MRRVLGLAAVATIVIACSSSNSNGNSSNDAGSGSGGSSGSSSGGSGSPGGGTTTLPDGGSLPTACLSLFTYEQKCAEDAYSGSQACLVGREQNCAATLAIYTSTFQAALAACNTTATDCNAGPDACYDQHLTGYQPTAAQTKVMNDYCAGCPAEPSCTSGFYTIDPVNGDGPGVEVLQVTDAIAAQIDAQCTGNALLAEIDAGGGSAGTDCTNGFAACAADVIASALPSDPDSCYAPGDDDDDAATDAAEDGAYDGSPEAGIVDATAGGG